MPRTLKVMMIDDNPDDFRLLAMSCEALKLTYIFDHRPSGESGLKGLETAKAKGMIPDVMLLDMDLPGLPGYEVLARIRADAQLARMSVVMLTGSEAQEDRDASRAADAYVVKPLTLSGWRDLAQRIGGYASRGVLAAAATAAPAASASTTVGAIAGGGHILHIDDDRDDRDLFAMAFAKSGLAGILHSLAGSAEALLYLNQIGQYANAERPALIVLDLSLPRLDGRGLLQLLSQNSRFKSIPVIVLTGSENFADVQRCRELGVTDYAVKPRTAQQLIELIASFAHWLEKPAVDTPST